MFVLGFILNKLYVDMCDNNKNVSADSVIEQMVKKENLSIKTKDRNRNHTCANFLLRGNDRNTTLKPNNIKSVPSYESFTIN